MCCSTELKRWRILLDRNAAVQVFWESAHARCVSCASRCMSGASAADEGIRCFTAGLKSWSRCRCWRGWTGGYVSSLIAINAKRGNNCPFLRVWNSTPVWTLKRRTAVLLDLMNLTDVFLKEKHALDHCRIYCTRTELLEYFNTQQFNQFNWANHTLCQNNIAFTE